MRRIATLFLVPSILVLPVVNSEVVRGAGIARGAVANSLQNSPAETSVPAIQTPVEVAQAPITTGTITVSKNLARQAAERANGGLSNYRAESAMHGPALDAPYRDGGDTWIFTFRGGAPGAGDFTVESEVAVNKTTLETIILYNGPLRSARSESSVSSGDRSQGDRDRAGTVQPEPVQPEPAQPDPEPVSSDPRQTTAPSPPAAQLAEEPEADSPAPEGPAAESSGPEASIPATPSTGELAPSDPDSSSASTRPAPSRNLGAPGDITTAKNFARQAAERVNGGLNNYSAEPSMHGPALESPFRDDGDRWIFTFRGGFPGDISLPIESEVAVSKSTLETTVLYNGPVR